MKQDSVIFNYWKTVNIYINNYPPLEYCSFGAVKLTNHVDVDQYKYSRYGIGFDRKGSYWFVNEVGRNVINSGVDMNLSPHIDNQKKDILILGKGPTQGLEHALTA